MHNQILLNHNPFDENLSLVINDLPVNTILKCFNKTRFTTMFPKFKSKNKRDLFGHMSITPKDFSSSVINSLLFNYELGRKDVNTYLRDLVHDVDFTIKLYNFHLRNQFYKIIKELLMTSTEIITYETLYYNPLYWIKFITKREVNACKFGPIEITSDYETVYGLSKRGIIEESDAKQILKYCHSWDQIEDRFDIQKLMIIMKKLHISFDDYRLIMCRELTDMMMCSPVMALYKDEFTMIPNTLSYLVMSDVTYVYNERLKKEFRFPYLDASEGLIDGLTFVRVKDKPYQLSIDIDDTMLREELILFSHIFNPYTSVTMLDSMTFVNLAKLSITINERIMRVLNSWKYIVIVSHAENPVIAEAATLISRIDSLMVLDKKVTIYETTPEIEARKLLHLNFSKTSIPKPKP